MFTAEYRFPRLYLRQPFSGAGSHCALSCFSLSGEPLRGASVPLTSCTCCPLPKISTTWPEWSPPCPWAHTGLIKSWCVLTGRRCPLPEILHPGGSSLALLTTGTPAWRCQSCLWVSTAFCFRCSLLGSIHPAASALQACLCQWVLSLQLCNIIRFGVTL